MRLEVLRIPSGADQLAALHYLPDSTIRDTLVVYAHGFTSGKYSMDPVASYLAGHGYAGITFDFVGHKLGASGGELRSPQDAVRNLTDVIAWAREHLRPGRLAMVGHSLGGLCALEAAAEEQCSENHSHSPLAGIACLCVGANPGRAFDSAIGKTMAAQRADYVSGTRAIDLLRKLDRMPDAAGRLNGLPALFVAATRDVLVSPRQVTALAATAGPASTVVEIDCSHLEAPDRSRGAVLEWLDGIV